MIDMKVRTWNIKDKEMIYVDDLYWFEERGIHDFEGLGSYETYDVMYHFGLWDDNGEPIYNEDIVEIQNLDETKTSYKSRVALTVNGFLVTGHPIHVKMGINSSRNLSEFCNYGDGGKYNVRCKKVGNIYENPELREELV